MCQVINDCGQPKKCDDEDGEFMLVGLCEIAINYIVSERIKEGYGYCCILFLLSSVSVVAIAIYQPSSSL